MNFARIINNWINTRNTETAFVNSTNIERSNMNLDSLLSQELTEEEMAAFSGGGGIALPALGKQGNILGFLFG